MNTTAGRPQILLAHFLSILLTVPAIVLFVLNVYSIPLVIVGIGILLLMVSVPASRVLSAGQRNMAQAILGEPVVQEYAASKGMGPIKRLNTWAHDRARWRDLLWQLSTMTIGLVLSILSIALFLYPLWSIVWFGLWKGLPDVFGEQYGMTITTTVDAVVLSAGGFVVGSLVWWFTAKPLARWRFGLDRHLLSLSKEELLERRVREVTASRAQGADAAAAELRRIERDLHDGAQARLVALGMNLGLAAELIENDPETARKLLLEARDNSGGALQDIRSVVRGIHPPVLADRGLADAVRAIAVDLPIEFELDLQPPRMSPPVESAIYFGIAECLTNVAKHSGAATGWVTIKQRNTLIHIEVGDNGVGGANSRGSGIQGVAGRLAVFDGTMEVSSPVGGPTIVTMEVPCEQ